MYDDQEIVLFLFAYCRRLDTVRKMKRSLKKSIMRPKVATGW